MTMTLFLVLSAAAVAQMDAPPAYAADIRAEREAPAPREPRPEDGDVIVFHSGRQLRGVRVVRETAINIEVEYLPGEPLLQLPRSQVDYIEYARDRVSPGAPGLANDLQMMPDVMPGEEVSVEFHRLLMMPLSEEAMVFEDADYLAVLDDFADRLDLIVEVGDDLLDMDEEERRFSRVIAPHTTLMSFLRRDLAEIAPDVRVILQFDRLVLQKRNAAAAPGIDAVTGE